VKNDLGIYTEDSGYSLIIDGNNVTNNTHGIMTMSASDTITNNTIVSNDYGITLGKSAPLISQNIIESNNYGINITDASSAIINNNFINWSVLYGISIQDSSNNNIYHNNFINNTIEAYDSDPGNNSWYNTSLLEGNYWSNYTGLDDGSGTGKHGIAGDGIGDTEISHPDTDYDFYPFMWPTHGGPVHNINTDEYFDTIQAAINDTDTLNGHTIEVEAGNYLENVVIDKIIDLMGRDINNTIIDANGSGDTVKIIVNWVNITGFTISQSGSVLGDAGIVLDNVQNCYIAENNISDNKNGVYSLYSNTSNLIESNYIHSNTESGILLNYSNLNNITSNNIYDNFIGIEIMNSNNNTILNNTITSNNYAGILLNTSEYHVINKNIIYNNSQGILFNTSSNNTISNNSITSNNNVDGVRINANSNDINIVNNNISSNVVGIYINSSSEILIENNTILYNENGVHSYYSSPVIRYNNISNSLFDGIGDVYYSNAIIGNNTIINNGYSGISNIAYSNGTINNNTISNNTYGIFCGDSSSPNITYNNITLNTYGINCSFGATATINWNNIHNNTNYNLSNGDPSINVSARFNYWGSGANPPNGIEGAVDYIPWEINPFYEAGPN
jgi:parallel beta-helix repeat protein